MCPLPADGVSGFLVVNAANTGSLKFQHQGQGHYLTPLFLLTLSVRYILTGLVDYENNTGDIHFYELS